MASLVMLVGWEIWNELNRGNSIIALLLAKINLKARTWVFAEANHLGFLMPEE
jgi:hypothetical protein